MVKLLAAIGKNNVALVVVTLVIIAALVAEVVVDISGNENDGSIRAVLATCVVLLTGLLGAAGVASNGHS